MKSAVYRFFVAPVLILAVLIALVPTAFAADGSDSGYTAFSEGEEYSYTLDGKTWTELTTELLSQYKIQQWQVGFGYFNTVTGETHYFNADTYFTSASMYKLPLCMYFNDKINRGELDVEEKYRGIELGELIRGTIEVSSNEYAHTLLKEFSGEKTFTREIAGYMGVDLETEPEDSGYFKRGNFTFTPRQYIHCLSLLWENSDDYELVINHMLQASPDRNFLFHEQPVPVAHKYGYLQDNGYLCVNDCGICYTDDPICIVMFTKGIANISSRVLADYCTLMCNYAQASREQRLEAEAQAEEEARLLAEETARLEREAEEERLRLEAEAQAAAELEAEEAVEVTAPEAEKNGGHLWIIALPALCVIAVIIIAVKKRRR